MFDCCLFKHRWRVGIMTEMAPVGYVGISHKCLLGFNKVCEELQLFTGCENFILCLSFVCDMLFIYIAESRRGNISSSSDR